MPTSFSTFRHRCACTKKWGPLVVFAELPTVTVPDVLPEAISTLTVDVPGVPPPRAIFTEPAAETFVELAASALVEADAGPERTSIV